MLEKTLGDAVEALEGLGLKYALVGGLAIGAWSIPRATRDVDLYVEMPSKSRQLLQQELRSRGFDVPAMEEELSSFGVFRSRSREGVFLDIFDAAGPLGEAILSRRKQASLLGRELWIVSPDDLALLKMFSDRARDFDDLVALFKRAEKLMDMAYVRKWAKILDESVGSDEISGRMEKALGAAKGRRD